MIVKGLTSAGAGPIVLAAPFHIPEIISKEFTSSGQIVGVVVERASGIAADLPIAGRWTDPGHSRLEITMNSPATLLFIGTAHEIGGRILLEAARKKIRKIVYLGTNSEFESRTPLDWLRSRAMPLVMSRLTRFRSVAGVSERILGFAGISFENGYRDLLERTAFLRLPPQAFDQRHAMLVAGSLGPGGAERQLAYSARGLARSGNWRVSVAVENLTPPLSNFHEKSIQDAGGEVHLVPMAASNFTCPKTIELLEYFREHYGAIGLHHVVEGIVAYSLFLREKRPSVFHTWMDACNVRAGLAAAIVGVPRLILSGRSVAPDHFGIFQPYMRSGYHAIISAVDPLILNNSRAGANDYARWLGIEPSRISVIHNGFEFPDSIASLRSGSRAELGFDNAHVVLGGIMRFSEEKRPDLWLNIAEQFVSAAFHHRAVLFGDGPMRETLLTEIEKRGLTGRILMPGVTRDAWASFAAFDIFLLTSRMEGLPNVLVEAQASGVPVVSPDVGGARETFVDGRTGLLAGDDGQRTLVNLCLQLAADPVRRMNMGQAAAAFARDEFGAEKMIQRTISTYSMAGTRD